MSLEFWDVYDGVNIQRPAGDSEGKWFCSALRIHTAWRVEFNYFYTMLFCKPVNTCPSGNLRYSAKGRAVANNRCCAHFQHLFGNCFDDHWMGNGAVFRRAFLNKVRLQEHRCSLFYDILNTTKKVKGLADSCNDFIPVVAITADDGDTGFLCHKKLKNDIFKCYYSS